METGTIEAADPHAHTCAADGKGTRKAPRRLAGALVVGLTLVLSAGFGATGASADPGVPPSSARYIVTFAAGVDSAQQTADVLAANASDSSSISELRMHVVDGTDLAAA